MAFFSSKKYRAGNDTWLDSRQGVSTAKTGTFRISSLDEGEGFVPSGTPVVTAEDGFLVPADGAAPTGFVIGDFPVSGSLDGEGLPVAFIWNGRIKTQNLPVESFTVPAEPGLFSYVGGDKGSEA